MTIIFGGYLDGSILVQNSNGAMAVRLVDAATILPIHLPFYGGAID
jgi:hypothetical protein